MQWHWLLSQKKLQQLGVDAVLNRYLIIALQQFPDPVSSFEKTKYVSSVGINDNPARLVPYCLVDLSLAR